MATPSSTSSSELAQLCGGPPWALFGAIALLAVVEVGVRLAPPEIAIPHQSGGTEYHTARCYLDAFGPAEISLFGTSRTRNGISVPELKARLEAACQADAAIQRRFGDARIANYACSGSNIEVAFSTLRYALRLAPDRPRIAIFGVSAQQLMRGEELSNRAAVFWDIPDWVEAFDDTAAQAADPRRSIWKLAPIVVRNELGKNWLTLKYRLRPEAFVNDIVLAWKYRKTRSFTWDEILRGAPSPSPIRGEPAPWHALEPERSLVTDPISDERVQLYLQRIQQAGETGLDPQAVRLARRMVELCRERNVPLIVFELPVSDRLARYLPPGANDDLRRLFDELADGENVVFVGLDQLGVSFSDADFREQSHLNLRGATKLSDALFERAILPELKRLSE
ncbi:MAG: hypothetical protein KDA32_06345 [Phycisphaerales bacterium]|nr:hypothetical protein [Phycisphaerales bacterium]